MFKIQKLILLNKDNTIKVHKIIHLFSIKTNYYNKIVNNLIKGDWLVNYNKTKNNKKKSIEKIR